MDFNSKPIPKYYQIYEVLADEIRSGIYKEGDRFPSDTELVERYDVSRGTIREALKMLFHQGYLVREQGRGTFVTYRKIQQSPDYLIGFRELMQRNNIKPSARIIEKQVLDPMPWLIRLMDLGPADKIVRLVRVRYGDDQPLIIERSFFHCGIFKPLMDKDLEKYSIFELLYRHTYTQLGDAYQRIEAVSAGQSEHELLQVPLGTPLLLMKRWIKTVAGEIFQYSEDVYRSDRISFTTRTSPYSKTHDYQGLPLDLSTEKKW